MLNVHHEDVENKRAEKMKMQCNEMDKQERERERENCHDKMQCEMR
jgi:hypothetical protein